jgi:hypothetical protein
LYARVRQLFSYSNIGTVNAVSGVISPTNLSLLSNPGGSPSSSSGGGGGGGGGGRSRGHSQTTLPRWNTQCSSGQPFITLDEDYMMTPLMSGNGGQGNAGTLIDDGLHILLLLLLSLLLLLLLRYYRCTTRMCLAGTSFRRSKTQPKKYYNQNL